MQRRKPCADATPTAWHSVDLKRDALRFTSATGCKPCHPDNVPEPSGFVLCELALAVCVVPCHTISPYGGRQCHRQAKPGFVGNLAYVDEGAVLNRLCARVDVDRLAENAVELLFGMSHSRAPLKADRVPRCRARFTDSGFGVRGSVSFAPPYFLSVSP
ncbi:hypothetical protein Y024_5458 [Burkholderia pseudomallei TSV44]|nr:hypothetical protein Y024_5458 [Burkholderia pseudomallei TSV44]